MALSRWQPLREMATLRDTMDRMFDQSFFQPLSIAGKSLVAMDLIERENELIVKASVPGVDPEKLDLSIHDDTLTISGSTEHQVENKREDYLLREHHVGRFERMLRLPVRVDAEAATAECRNGVLTLTLPKVQEARPHRIRIQGSTNGHSEHVLEHKQDASNGNQ